MKLYLIRRTGNCPYDAYDAAVVAAENEAEARAMHPGAPSWTQADTWVPPERVIVEYIGETSVGAGVILASFNAG